MPLKCYLVRVTTRDGHTLTSTRLAHSQAAAERIAQDDAWEDLRLPPEARGTLVSEVLREVSGPYLEDYPPDWDYDPTLRIYNRIPSAFALTA